MNDRKKRKNNNINSTNDINLISPLTALESKKILYFQKINSLHDINTLGSQPVVVYKKTPKNNNFNPKSPNNLVPKNIKMKNDLNKYISEEKIGKKLQKFNSFSNVPSSHHQNKKVKIKKTKSFNGNIIQIEQENKLKEEKERKKNINEQKLFSKTVRESNMRPIFPKNKNRQLNLTKNCFSIRHTNNENEKSHLNRVKEKENSKEEAIDKNKVMNQLIENAVAIEIKKYQNEKPKITMEAIKNAKKRECLEENGITTSSETTENENEKNENLNDENMNEKNKKKSPNISAPKHNNFIYPEDITYTHSNSNIPLPKAKNKPYIEQFEFIQKIKEEQKKFISAPRKNNSFNKNLNENYNNYYYSANPSSNFASPKITDSFRKKNKRNSEEQRKFINDRNDKKDYSVEDKKNHRSTREINEYLREKRIKNKQIEETKQLEKNKKLFLRFKNLYNLNMKDYKDFAKTVNHHKTKQRIPIKSNNQRQKKSKNNHFEERKDDKMNIDANANTNKIINNENPYPISNKYCTYNIYVNNNKITNHNYNNNGNCIRKKKEINQYYIGNDSTLKNNNSTVVDVNEYFLNILESQQLLVNSKLKKIDNNTESNKVMNIQENVDIENNGTNNDTHNEEINKDNDINELKNNLILNELNVSKEQIKKIIDREKTGSSNSKKSEEILNTSSIEKIKQKINKTLERANLFFSKDVLENYKQNVLNNVTDNSNSISNNTGNKSKRNTINSNSENITNTNNNEKEKNLKKEAIEKENEENKCENIKIDNYLNNEDIKPKKSDTKIEIMNNNNNNKNIQKALNINNIINNINDLSERNKLNNENTNIENLEIKSTNEQNLSLSHNYTSNNSNPNKKVEIKMEPRAVLNLVEIIKFIIQRKIFVILYESYINHAIFQQYSVAFSFFVAICKQYPFRKLEEYYNYKTYNYTFRQLLRPFNRRNFKYFLDCFHMRKKIEYLVVLLTKMIKFKSMERIFIYGQYSHEDDEEVAFKLIILKIMNTLIRPHLYEAFYNLRNNLYQNNNDKNSDDNKEDENKDDSEVNFNISDDDDNMNINNYFNDLKNQINESNLEKTENSNINLNSKEGSIENSNSKENANDNCNINNMNNNNDDNINVKINENSSDNIEINISSNIKENSFMNHRRKNDSSIKMHSFLYESFDSEEKSSIVIEPNSLDNDKLHQLKMAIMNKNKDYENSMDDNYINYENEIDNNNIDLNYEINNNSHSSKKSGEKSLQDLINMKIGKNINKTLSDMMMEENSLQKSGSQNTIDDLQKNLGSQMSINSKNKENENENNNLKNNSNSNSSIISIGYKNKNEGRKDEEIKLNNDTKDTKEVTDDSNTINMNTNNKSDSKTNIKINENYSGTKSNNINILNIKIDEPKTIECNDNDNNNNTQKEEKIELNNKQNDENKDINENKVEDNKISGNNKVIEVEYKIPRNNLKSQLLKNYKIIDKNDDQNAQSSKKSKDLSEEGKNSEKELLLKPKLKIPLIKIINDSNDSTSENKNSKEDIKTKSKFCILENKEKFSDDLVNEIMNKLIFTEIKSSKIKLLPNKKYKFDKFLKKSNNNNNSSQSQNNSLANSCNSAGNIRDSHQSGSSLNQLSLHEDLFSLNDSMNSNYSEYSVFNKTIKDKKKEHSLNLYFKNICPKLISYLHKEIIKKFPRIYENISLQKKNISENLMISLVLQDAQMLRNNYKKMCFKENLEKILDKREILKNFSSINRKIRQEDNITSDNYYDNMLNECVLETAIELIEKERFYGDNGEPLKWSSRTREISFKYEKKDAKKFSDYICKNILKIIHNRIGLINDNYSYLNQDEINYEREKRLLDTIKSDLNGNESQWKNLEMEETQLKIESTEMILDQLYNEVIEILEHIQLNRVNPELYQFKSIYGCEEIPKLSFQQTTTEDVAIPEGDENDFMNIYN